MVEGCENAGAREGRNMANSDLVETTVEETLTYLRKNLDTTNADGPELSDQSDVDRRLAVLEERTKPKPKSFVKNITQWSGVATFLLASLYTFPLGVWDRFFVSQEEEVRSLIVKLTDADTELFKISQSLPASQMFNISASVQAKKTALLLPKNRSF
jgi:hypothetical protein